MKLRTSRHRPRKRSTKNSLRTQTDSRGARKLTAVDRARVIANQYIILHYPLGVLSGTPCRVRGDGSDLWIAPVILTSPGTGAVGLVGMVAVDARREKVVAATPPAEVAAEGKRLREERGHELETAFLQARTG